MSETPKTLHFGPMDGSNSVDSSILSLKTPTEFSKVSRRLIFKAMAMAVQI
jgi:hypothetical protein